MKPFRSMLVATLAAISVAGPGLSHARANRAELPSEGVNLRRPKGGWINVSMGSSQMTVRFFDPGKTAVAPDVGKATVRIRYTATSHIERAVLATDGLALRSSGNLRPPYYFAATLTLLPEKSDSEGGALETHIFSFP